MLSWKAKYTITIGSVDQREHDIDIDDPTDQEISGSPFYKGDRENTRRYLAKRKADERIIKFCDRLAIETESPTCYKLNSLDFMEDGVRKFSQREASIGVGCQIGAPISEADFLSLEQEVSAHVNDLLDSYSELYNKYLKSADIFEKYKLLYLIANKEAYKDLALRTIRNMLHHTELDIHRHPDQCRKAEELFGPGIRSIELSNPDHQKVVRDHLPQLRGIAKSIIDGLK
jgi:hypothetical protein